MPPPERRAGKDSWLIGVAALVSLVFMAVLMAPHVERALSGANDFAPLYTGSRLLQTGDLYNHEKLLETAANLTGMSSPDQGYIRLPFHAALLWPLSRLPYRTAYLVWFLASLSAVVLFIALWRPPGGSIVLLFTCLSVPVFAALLNGQDSTFLLLFVALSAALLDRSRPFAAGLVWSLCAIKFHLFLLTPVFILARRQWRFAQGLLAGGAVLAAVSFAVAGWGWPLEFFASATNPAFSPRLELSPTLHGILASVSGGLVLEILLGATVLAAVWFVCRYSDQRLALAAMLAGGLLLSVHAYLPDLSLLLPAALTAMALAQTRLARLATLALLTPLVHLSVTQGLPYSAIAVGLVLALVYGLAHEARARSRGDHSSNFGNERRDGVGPAAHAQTIGTG
jgi:hypothetical protein